MTLGLRQGACAKMMKMKKEEDKNKVRTRSSKNKDNASWPNERRGGDKAAGIDGDRVIFSFWAGEAGVPNASQFVSSMGY